MHHGSGTLCVPKTQLGIEVDIVVPRQPVGHTQLAVRQGHHLREAGVAAIHLVDHALRHHNILLTDDLHRSIVPSGVAHPRAHTHSHRNTPEPAHFTPPTHHIHLHRILPNIPQ